MAQGPNEDEGPYDWCIESDASWKKGIAGFGYRAYAQGGRKGKGRSLAGKAHGSQHAEALCIIAAMRDVLRRGGAGSIVRVRCDSSWLINVLNGNGNVARPYLVAALREIRELEQKFCQVDYEWVPSKHLKKSDKAASRGRKRAEEREAARVAARSAKVQSAYRRAVNLRVTPIQQRVYVVAQLNGTSAYTVDLDNLTCSCAYFTQKWANKTTGARAKNMTPCAHMAAASLSCQLGDMPWDRYRVPSP